MFNQLETFKMVYEVQNFSLAAKQLFIAQPTVSTHIQQLERYFGQQLFQRKGRKEVQPTPAARRLYARVNHLLDDWQSITEVMGQTDSEDTFHVRIGASQTVAVYKLPQVLTQLTTQFKKMVLTVEMANSATILKRVSEHKLDFGFIEKPITTDGVRRRDFGTDQLVRAGDLNSDMWLLREEGSGVGYYTRMFLQSENIQPKRIMKVANNEIIVQLLKQGLGQTIVSKRAVPVGIAFEALPKSYQRHFYLLSRDHLTTQDQRVEQYLMEHLSDCR
ncbi:LysR substrate-binding domain-containing protein [Agrilactobacillus yilanensis]|uniref:LysR substrate-binding domain-containing protein n=1 Tax=Agrilactobacillus yilanensis TaxID=2485997 RepID=A0ABW4J2D8_9LACO|nr:LysR family transcriptional regulator [Agrilactobacillus yilanensis]